jgi:hypothetical protein
MDPARRVRNDRLGIGSIMTFSRTCLHGLSKRWLFARFSVPSKEIKKELTAHAETSMAQFRAVGHRRGSDTVNSREALLYEKL